MKTGGLNPPQVYAAEEIGRASLKRYWGPIAGAGSFVASLVTAALLPLSIGLSSGDASHIEAFAALLCAITLSVLYLIHRLLPNLHRVILSFFAIVFLGLTVYAMYNNYNQVNAISCVNPKDGSRVIRGTIIDPYAFAQFRLSNAADYCGYLWLPPQNGKSWSPPQLWTQASIDAIRGTLIRSYTFCFPLMAAALYGLLLALGPQPDERKSKAGKLS